MGGGSFSTRHGRLLILSLTVCAAAMIGAVWWYYQRQRQAAENAAVSQLAAIADFKTKQIANWRQERIGDARALAVSPLMRSAQRILAGGRATDEDRTDMMTVMGRLSREFLYTDAALVDLEGSVHIRLNEDRSPADQLRQGARRALSRESVKAGDPVLSDLTLDTRYHRPMMALAIPVRDLGALILEIDPGSFLYPYLQAWPTTSPTAESFLVRLDPPNTILVLSELRHQPGSALVYHASYGPSDLPDDAELKSGWIHGGTDYRGVPALKVSRRVPDSPWYLTAKIDRSEVEAPLTRLSWEMLLVVGLIAAANCAGVGLIWRNGQLQAYRESEERLRAIANDTPAYLWMYTTDGGNSFINKPLEKFLGSGDQVLTNGRWASYMGTDDRERVRTTFLRCRAARSEYVAEFRLRRSDGEYRQVVSHGVPRFSEKGEFLGYAGSIVDITERKKAEAQLRSANTGLERELRERTRAEQEIQALSARLINAHEEERTRLARELHDDISQQIAALIIGMGNLKRKMTPQPEALEQSSRIQQKLAHLADSTRRLSRELHPAVLQHCGLAAALETYCGEFAALTSHRITFHAEGPCDLLPPGVALSVYRVAQEALQNSIKHSRVSEAEVRLTSGSGVVSLEVSDHGVGMDAESAGGLGLVSIKERTRLVNGSVEVKSQPGEGVTVTMKVPIPEEGLVKAAS